MLRRVALLGVIFLGIGATARAEEGMWTFYNFPKAKVQSQ